MSDTTKPYLGPYVCVRARKNGSHRAIMVVPERLRPEGWPKSIRLPEMGNQSGSLGDPAFVNRIRENAERLKASLDLQRELSRSQSDEPTNLPELAEKYFRSPGYEGLSQARRYRNKLNIKRILQWSASRRHPKLNRLTESVIDEYLSAYKLGSWTRYDMRATWSVLMTYALRNHWITSYPLQRGEWHTPKPIKPRRWTDEDVVHYSTAAEQIEQPGLAALIIVGMWIGQRSGDLRALEWGANYTGDSLWIEQSKTHAEVDVIVPQPIRDVIQSVRVEGSPYLFNDWDTKTGFTVSRLHERFLDCRDRVGEVGKELLYLRALRHSCVHHLLETGLSAGQISAITGHSLPRMHFIIESYNTDRRALAASGMRKAFEAKGYAPEEFGEVASRPIRRTGTRTGKVYQEPQFTQKNFFRKYAAVTGQHRNRAVVSPELVNASPGPLLSDEGVG